MPVEMSTFQLPGGTRCVQVVSSGHFSKEDAEAVLLQTNPGGSLHGLPQLVLTLRLESLTADARGIFATRGWKDGQEPWVAVVVVNPVIRVTTNFLVRINGNKKIKMFAGEAEAVQWLDERVREDAAEGKSPPS